VNLFSLCLPRRRLTLGIGRGPVLLVLLASPFAFAAVPLPPHTRRTTDPFSDVRWGTGLGGHFQP